MKEVCLISAKRGGGVERVTSDPSRRRYGGSESYLRKYRWPVGVLAISQPWGSGTSSGMMAVAAPSGAWLESELTGREAGEEWARM